MYGCAEFGSVRRSEESPCDQSTQERSTIRFLLQMLHQLGRGDERADGVQPEPSHRVGHGGDGLLWAVSNPIGDLEYFTGQPGIATDDLRERVGA
jgi:hypothetical protein